MSLFNVFDIAGSALGAQSVRLNTTASNMANADSIASSIDETYKARHPVFAALQASLSGQADADANAGVQVTGIVESQKEAQAVYMPDNPMADAQGYVYRPNVNIVEEMADMISASRSYQANVQVANTAKQLVLRTLQLGQ
ncbi:MAG: flagellar basal body rod protein FlgC [Gammaproteobacteria bacterium]|nr:flagellar basal body rod protein FlgC [Gammaproteobacteria bacterium]